MWAVLILWWLACLDLMVGVVNDAVNFLNSAFGSRVATRKVILWVAAAGLFVGAWFSSWMMEIARSGVFNPAVLSYYDIMMVFFAVIIADIILLDLYNSLWLQTSTTVSIIFELLWAWLGIGMIALFGKNLPIGDLAQYINASSTFRIISGIFLSIFISFSAGWLVQSVLRLVFTFDYQPLIDRIGWLFGGVSLSTIGYFLIIKGMKGMSFVPQEFVSFFTDNTVIGFGVLVFFFALVLWIAQRFWRANVLKITVLGWTFAIAAAFASNDLVNFIGVSIAGFQATVFYLSQSLPVDAFMMDVLQWPIATPWFILFLAAFLMMLSLIYSKKAIRITDTELAMTTHKIGEEKFVPGAVSRWVLRSCLRISSWVQSFFPSRVQRYVQKRFAPQHYSEHAVQQDYDLLRASVNLTLAALLIALATTMKLPLSTTYVTFMVAMGTALADGAWWRDSAVYRISGMLTVIVWWLLTWFLALSTAFILVLVLWHTWMWWVGVWIVCTAFLLYRTHRSGHDQDSAMKYRTEGSLDEILDREVALVLGRVRSVYPQLINALLTYDAWAMKICGETVSTLLAHTKNSKKHIHYLFQSRPNDAESITKGFHYSSALERVRKLVMAFGEIEKSAHEYILNQYPPLDPVQDPELLELTERVVFLLDLGIEILVQWNDQRSDELLWQFPWFEEYLHMLKKAQLERIQHHIVGVRNTTLYLHLLTETEAVVAHLFKLHRRMRMMRDVVL
jgi:hypothetical protein